MAGPYILGIDQSTQGTKTILFDEKGNLIARADRRHEQLINEKGYISHNPMDLYWNTLASSGDVIRKAGIDPSQIVGIGISNQRETTLMWDENGNPLDNAVVWQCSRASEVIEQFRQMEEEIRQISGLVLSPYYPAGKMRWLLDNSLPDLGTPPQIHLGTVDSWLVYKLTGGKEFKTDASNASRTQLFDLQTGNWSPRLCEIFGINPDWLPEIVDSNALFGYTDLDGLLPNPIPIHAVMGDSHAALYGQGCHEKGQVKTTMGTGSSIMMNIGDTCTMSKQGLSTSLAWRIDGVTEYAFEGNINYAGAVITWLQDDLGLVRDAKETEELARSANPLDETVFVPAFSGLSAPYWDEKARGMICNMSRTTGRKEIVKAALESIAYQITDILNAMASDSALALREVKVDGGPTKNRYLMEFLSNIAHTNVLVSRQEELSAIGVAYLAGISCGLYRKEDLFAGRDYQVYAPVMDMTEWKKRMDRWYDAIERIQKEKKERQTLTC